MSTIFYSVKMAIHTSGLSRDLEIIELLGSKEAWENGGFGVQQIANILRRDKGQISRVCQTLLRTGLLNREVSTKRYTLGHHLYALAMRTQEARLTFLARPKLLELMASAEESSHLTVLRGGAIMKLHTEFARHERKESEEPGSFTPALKTASGRAILATFSTEELSAWWEQHGSVPHLPRNNRETQVLRAVSGEQNGPSKPSIRSLDQLERVIRTIRRRGFAISEGEITPGIVDAAAPLRNSSSAVVGAIAVGAHRSRIKDGYQGLGAMVRESAELLSRELGWVPSA